MAAGDAPVSKMRHGSPNDTIQKAGEEIRTLDIRLGKATLYH